VAQLLREREALLLETFSAQLRKDKVAIQTQFREQGFVVVPSVFQADEMDDLVAEAMRITDTELTECQKSPYGGASNKMGVKSVPKLGYLVDLDPTGESAPRPRKIDSCFEKGARFRKVAISPRLRAVVSMVQEAQATGTDTKNALPAEALLFTDQAFMKPPHFGSPKPYHQDNFYFRCTPADDVITCWIALDDADEANGCLRYIKGSHLQGLFDHGRIPGDPNESNLSPSADHIKECISIAEKKQLGTGGGEAPAPVKKGGVVLHHSLTLHCSGANTSDRWRRAYATHWVSPRVDTENDAGTNKPLFATKEWVGAVGANTALLKSR
jgi:hypothetical protein